MERSTIGNLSPRNRELDIAMAKEISLAHERSGTALSRVRGMQKHLRTRDRELKEHTLHAAWNAQNLTSDKPSVNKTLCVYSRSNKDDVRRRISRGISEFQESLGIAYSNRRVTFMQPKRSCRVRRARPLKNREETQHPIHSIATHPIMKEREKTRQEQEGLRILSACIDSLNDCVRSKDTVNSRSMLTPVQHRFLTTLRHLVTSNETILCRKTLTYMLFRFVQLDDLKHPDLEPVLDSAFASVGLLVEDFYRSIQNFG